MSPHEPSPSSSTSKGRTPKQGRVPSSSKRRKLRSESLLRENSLPIEDYQQQLSPCANGKSVKSHLEGLHSRTREKAQGGDSGAFSSPLWSRTDWPSSFGEDVPQTTTQSPNGLSSSVAETSSLRIDQQNPESKAPGQFSWATKHLKTLGTMSISSFGSNNAESTSSTPSRKIQKTKTQRPSNPADIQSYENCSRTPRPNNRCKSFGLSGLSSHSLTTFFVIIQTAHQHLTESKILLNSNFVNMHSDTY
jgi:hypothetical protein